MQHSRVPQRPPPRPGGRWGQGSNAIKALIDKLQLPDERIGTLLVFRTFDRMSYGLIVGTSNPIRVFDVVRTP